MPLTMTASLRARLLATGLDRLALGLIALGFVLMLVGGLLNGHGPLNFISMFLGPIVDPNQSIAPVDLLFAAGLLLAGVAAWRRTEQTWRTPASEVAGSVPLGSSWRQRAARAAAVLGERRGRSADEAPETPPGTPQALLSAGEQTNDEPVSDEAPDQSEDA